MIDFYTKKLTIIVLLLLATAGCANKRDSSATDDLGFTSADSIVYAVGDERDFPRMQSVLDSLEEAGELSLVKTIFYRTIMYNLLGQQSTSLRYYYQLAGIDVEELTTQADLEAYVFSYNNYVRLLCDMRRYDRALREAYTADRKLKSIGYNSFADHHDIAQIIGECQLYLDQAAEAEQSFQKSLNAVHTRLEQNCDPLDLRECQKTMNAIAKAYIHKNLYAEAEPWIRVQDSLYVAADTHPQRDSVYVDEMKAEINYSKALLANGLARADDAERAFAAYASTNTAKQLGSIINSCEYLMLTRRYDEAAHNYEQLDRFLIEGGFKADLENFGRYNLPKFRANLLAGRRDTALKVADAVARYYDTALVRQKMIDADLLTTVYDTEGKERQIAEQRAELSHQRLISLAVLLVVIVLFFHIYIYQRRKAYKKLNDTNTKLILANERAQESSRMKTKFIQQISHEVRTPLNVLSGFTQVLASPDIELSSDELRSFSKEIVDNSERITQLIDKMLDLSQTYSLADIECHDTLSPAEVATQAIDMSGIRQTTHLTFQLHISPQAQALTLTTNRTSAVKALAQLLDNAKKYTRPQDRVTLSVTLSPPYVLFIVEDTGIGVPPAEAEHIFDEFVQLNEYSEGTGIGLTVARTLARHIGGDIILDTSYTSGARFVMTLHC